jgi:nitrogen PTS system EIIA component
MKLSDFLFPADIKVYLESSKKDEVFKELVESITATHHELSKDELLRELQIREKKMNTGIFPGLAVPHAYSSSIHDTVLFVGTSSSGIVYDSFDGNAVYIVFMILMSKENTERHLQLLREISLLAQNERFRSEAAAKKSAQDVFDTVCRYEQII